MYFLFKYYNKKIYKIIKEIIKDGSKRRNEKRKNEKGINIGNEKESEEEGKIIMKCGGDSGWMRGCIWLGGMKAGKGPKRREMWGLHKHLICNLSLPTAQQQSFLTLSLPSHTVHTSISLNGRRRIRCGYRLWQRRHHGNQEVPLLRQSRSRSDAPGRCYHGRRQRRPGPHRWRGRGLCGYGPRASTRGHPGPGWCGPHERPTAHQGNQAGRHHPRDGKGPHRALRGGPDPGGHRHRLRGRERGSHPGRWRKPHQQTQLPHPLCLRLPQPRWSPPPHPRGRRHDPHQGRGRHRQHHRGRASCPLSHERH